ncbi:MAG: alpha/beta hydrolase [Proteobacteria bacterium]|nr:alpha/beta hydrolase [Pseudomonadota bacterium]MDA1357430.1 alpha/beta hydrolase [Pseudomonadota bacterium]
MMTINNKYLEIEQHGQGDAMIMVHGLGGTSNAWYPQATLLARSFHVIRPDMEGSGRSPAKGKISIASLVKDVSKLMDKLNIKSAHFIGHSMGTIVCQHLAASSPARVKSLALLGPLAEPPQAARGAIKDRASAARSNGMTPIADTLVQVALSADSRVHQPSVAAFVREIIMRQDAEGYARTCEALAVAKSADLSKIKCRTLLITGDEDGVAPPASVQKLSRAIKGSKAIILDRCGHWTPIERSSEVNAALMNFYFG